VKAKNLERKIARIEGIDVKIMKNGRKVQSSATIAANYKYENAAPNGHTADKLLKTRLAKSLPGYDVIVLDSSGAAVTGNTKLKNVRAGYEE